MKSMRSNIGGVLDSMREAPWRVPAIGLLITLGGILTPFFGVEVAQVILGYGSTTSLT